MTRSRVFGGKRFKDIGRSYSRSRLKRQKQVLRHEGFRVRSVKVKAGVYRIFARLAHR